MSTDLTRFLLSRITEDERAVPPGSGGSCTTHTYMATCRDCPKNARRLAECEAKRRVVTLMGYVRESWENKHSGEGRVMWPDVNRREKLHALTILENLALPYADHPDYREEWRP